MAKILPFFSSSDRSGDGGGVAFLHSSFFCAGSSRSELWLMSSGDSGTVINLVDPEALRQREGDVNSHCHINAFNDQPVINSVTHLKRSGLFDPFQKITKESYFNCVLLACSSAGKI